MYRMIIRSKIRQAFAALSRGDTPTLLAAMAPDVHHSFPGASALGGERRTIVDVETWFQRLFRLLPGLQFTIQTLAVDGPPWDTRIGVEWTNTGTLLDGSQYANTGAHILRVRWAKIVAFHAYLDDQAAFDSALARLARAGMTEAHARPILSVSAPVDA